MTNLEIRMRAMNRGVKMWQIADALCISDSNLSRRLRKELSTEEKDRIFAIIDRLADNKGEEAVQ